MDEKKINTKIVLDKSAGEELGDVVGLNNYYTKEEAQAKIDSENKLDADLVDDSNSTNKFVSAQDKTTWNGKSVVVPNPTLAGTESNLDGIEIDGVKYKAGGSGGNKYEHKISYTLQQFLVAGKYYGSKVNFIIVDDNPNAYSSHSIYAMLQEKGLIKNYLNITCLGTYYNSDTDLAIMSFDIDKYENGLIYGFVRYIMFSTEITKGRYGNTSYTEAIYSDVGSTLNFIDTVTQL